MTESEAITLHAQYEDGQEEDEIFIIHDLSSLGLMRPLNSPRSRFEENSFGAFSVKKVRKKRKKKKKESGDDDDDDAGGGVYDDEQDEFQDQEDAFPRTPGTGGTANQDQKDDRDDKEVEKNGDNPGEFRVYLDVELARTPTGVKMFTALKGVLREICHQVPREKCCQVPKESCNQLPKESCRQVPKKCQEEEEEDESRGRRGSGG